MVVAETAAGLVTEIVVNDAMETIETAQKPAESAQEAKIPAQPVASDDHVNDVPETVGQTNQVAVPVTESRSKKRKKRSGKSTEARGPTALPPSRGTGCEGL